MNVPKTRPSPDPRPTPKRIPSFLASHKIFLALLFYHSSQYWII